MQVLRNASPISLAIGLVGENAPAARRLGIYERFIHRLSALYPRHFCIVAELTKGSRPQEYRAAFSAVQRRHPLLSVFIAETAEGPVLRPADRPIPLTFLQRSEEDDWRHVVARELATAFPDDRAPLLRVTIVEGTASDAVVLTFHHAAADAMSAVYIIRDLMEALDGRALAHLPLLPPLEVLARHVLSPDAAVAPQAEEDADSARSIGATLPATRERDRPVVSTLRFDRRATDLIRRACRFQGTTLHGALCAAVAQSLAHADVETFTIACPINARPMPGVDAGHCAMLAYTGFVRLPLRDRDFWRHAQQTTADLAAARTPQGVLASSAALKLPPPGVAEGRPLGDTAVVSNLGVLPIPERFGKLELLALWGPFVEASATAEGVVGAASVGGQLHLTQTTPRRVAPFLETLGRILVEACFDARPFDA